MELSKQVCSLELAQKLLTLGVKQNSLFFWHHLDTPYPSIIYMHEKTESSGDFLISAFTASELLEMLPTRINTKTNVPFNNFRIRIEQAYLVPENNVISTFLVNYRCDTAEITNDNDLLSTPLFSHNLWDENLANALAQCLIKLIEEGFMND